MTINRPHGLSHHQVRTAKRSNACLMRASDSAVGGAYACSHGKACCRYRFVAHQSSIVLISQRATLHILLHRGNMPIAAAVHHFGILHSNICTVKPRTPSGRNRIESQEYKIQDRQDMKILKNETKQNADEKPASHAHISEYMIVHH